MKLQKTLSAIVLAFVGLILCVSAQAQRTATATPTVANGFVIAITVTDGGTGYVAVPTVAISGGNGSGAFATATVVNGAVSKVIVVNAGSGYTGTPSIVIAAPPLPKTPFSDGLILYYPLDGNALDFSPSANNGIIHGATPTVDRFGNLSGCYLFSGIENYIESDFIITDVVNTFTISLWMQAPTKPAGDISFLFPSQGSGTWGDSSAGVGFVLSPNTIRAVEHTSGYVRDSVQSSGDFSVWTQIIVVYSNQVPRMYLNGRLVSTGTMSSRVVRPSSGLHNTFVQNYGVGGFGGFRSLSTPFQSQWFNGKMDDIRIYNRALSDQEVEDLYAYEAPEQPSLTINVETVRVTMHVKPTKKYQLEASLDLTKWTKAGDVFTATTSEVTQQFNAIEVGRYFRLSEVQ